MDRRGREAIQLGPTLPVGDPEEEGNITSSGIVSKEQGVQAPHWAPQS